MLGAIEDDSKVTAVNHTARIFVKFVESSVDNFLACSIGATTKANKELVKVNKAIHDCVQSFYKDARFFLRDAAAKIFRPQ